MLHTKVVNLVWSTVQNMTVKTEIVKRLMIQAFKHQPFLIYNGSARKSMSAIPLKSMKVIFADMQEPLH